MSKPVRFTISHVSDKPINRKAFKKATQTVSGYLWFKTHDGTIKPGWGADADLIHFGGSPFDFDNQTPVNIARDPATYLKEGGDCPVEVYAMTPAYIDVVRSVVGLINHHTGNALRLTQYSARSSTNASKRSRAMVGAK